MQSTLWPRPVSRCISPSLSSWVYLRNGWIGTRPRIACAAFDQPLRRSRLYHPSRPIRRSLICDVSLFCKTNALPIAFNSTSRQGDRKMASQAVLGPFAGSTLFSNAFEMMPVPNVAHRLPVSADFEFRTQYLSRRGKARVRRRGGGAALTSSITNWFVISTLLARFVIALMSRA